MRTIYLALIAIILGVIGLACAGTAYAQPADAGADVVLVDAGSATAPATTPTLPDPIESPIESVSFVVKLWKSGTMPAAIIVGLFLLLTALSKKIKALQKGYAAIVVASVLGGCSMLIERAAAGTTPNLAMFTSAIVAAVALALNPKKASA